MLRGKVLYSTARHLLVSTLVKASLEAAVLLADM
jgi:hypothetical protein